MGKKRVNVGHQVIVDIPRAIRVYGITVHTRTDDELLRMCEEIKRDIVRHVNVDSPSLVYVNIVREDQCSHCGSRWTEGDSPHNGGCCPEDIAVLEEHTPT